MSIITSTKTKLESLVCLQLASARQSGDDVLSIKSLYNNIRKFCPEYKSLEYSSFLAELKKVRHLFDLPSYGEIGNDFNYLSLKVN